MDKTTLEKRLGDLPSGMLYYDGTAHVALIDPFCVPRNLDKPTIGIDLDMGAKLDKLRDRTGTDISKVLVTEDAVWIGDGLVLGVLVESVVGTIMRELRRNVRVYVPLDRGGTAAFGISEGKIVSAKLLRASVALTATINEDAASSREARLLKVREDVAVPPELAASDTLVVPMGTDITPFTTKPAAMALAMSRMPMRATIRQAAAGAVASLATIGTAYFLAAIVGFDTLPERDPADVASADPSADDISWLDEEVVGDEEDQAVPVESPLAAALAGTSEEDIGAPRLESSVRWDLAAWSALVTEPPWHTLGVDKLTWERTAAGNVVVSAFGRDVNLDVWESFAQQWGAKIEGDDWISRLGYELPMGEGTSSVMVYERAGAWDIRPPLGDFETAPLLCRNNLGMIVSATEQELACAVRHWVSERWSTSGAALPPSTLAKASCEYERIVGQNIVANCMLTFAYSEQNAVEIEKELEA